MSDFDFRVLSLPFKLGDWADADERMFRACFTILGQFVESELGPSSDKWDIDAQYRGYRLHSTDDEEKRAIDLWLWYRAELPAVEEAYAADLMAQADRKSRKRAKGFSFDHVLLMKDQKLRELIDIRSKLWT